MHNPTIYGLTDYHNAFDGATEPKSPLAPVGKGGWGDRG